MEQTSPLRRISTGLRKRTHGLREYYRSRRLSWRVEAMSRRARTRAKTAQLKLRRAAFEAGAVARSSATIAGLSADARRAATRVRASASRAGRVVDKTSLAAGRLRGEWRGNLELAADQMEEQVAALANAARAVAGRVKDSALRSRTVSGIAIDSRRAAKRLRSIRGERKVRPSH